MPIKVVAMDVALSHLWTHRTYGTVWWTLEVKSFLLVGGTKGRERKHALQQLSAIWQKLYEGQ